MLLGRLELWDGFRCIKLVPPGRNDSVAAIWPLCRVKASRGGKTHMKKEAKLLAAAKKPEFELQPEIQHSRPSSQYCTVLYIIVLCDCVKNPIKNL